MYRIVSLLYLIDIIYGLAVLYALIKKDKNMLSVFSSMAVESGIPKFVITIVVIAAAVYGVWVSPTFTSLNPSIWSRSTGTYCYTVSLESSNGKEYILPAKIEVYDAEEDIPKQYLVTEVYLQNSKIVCFEDCYINKNDEKEPSKVEDENGKAWILTFINKPNYTDQFEPDSFWPSRFTIILDVISYILFALAIIGSLYDTCFIKDENM